MNNIKIIGSIRDDFTGKDFVGLRRMIKEFPQIHICIDKKDSQALDKVINLYVRNTDIYTDATYMRMLMLNLLASVDVKFANKFNQYILENNEERVNYGELHLDHLVWERDEGDLKIYVADSKIDVVEIIIPKDVNEIEQLKADKYNYKFGKSVITELRILNYSKTIDTNEIEGKLLEFFNEYNFMTNIKEVKLINK